MENNETPPTAEQKFQTGKVTAIALSHLTHDTYQAFLPTLLPIFISTFSLSKLQGGAFSAFNQFPSLIQPVIGYLSDRKNLRWLVIAAPAASALIMSVLGVMPGYWYVAFLLFLAGFFSAGLHAIGPAVIGQSSGIKTGRGMSFWMVAGESGRALGPLIMVSAIQLMGLNRTPLLMVVGLGISIWLYFVIRKIPGTQIAATDRSDWKPVLKKIAPFICAISFIHMAVSFIVIGISTFLPTFLTEEGSTLWFAGASLTIMEVAGVVGAMFSGTWSDKVGKKPLLVGAILISPIALVLFLFTSGFLKTMFLILTGFSMLSLQPILLAWIQQSYPEQRALANGLYMAINFVTRSFMVILIGWMGDQIGLQKAFLICAAIAFVALPVVWLTPLNPNQKKSTV